jgi:hypothetical protein
MKYGCEPPDPVRFVLTIIPGLLVLAAFAGSAHADDLATMDVTTLRALDSTLTGGGILVAQAEALDSTNLPAFEINPAAVGEPESFFAWISTNGAYTNYPNAAGTESGHAEAVGLNIFGASQGVAPGIEHLDNYEADYFYQYIIVTNFPIPDSVVNQSFAFFEDPTNEPPIDSAYDNYIATNGNIFSSAVNGLNDGVGPPGTAYNCIGVGAYGVNAVITTGPTPDNGRSKPDIVAPGFETSFTIPYVTGAAAVLLQAAARGDGGSATTNAADRRTVKALLLNGALKPFDWSHATNAPLDTRYGAGVLNLFRSYQQLAGGRQTCTASNSVASGAGHPPVSGLGTIASPLGWDFETITTPPQQDAVNHYLFNPATNSTFTATLVWERQAGMTNINQLALFLYDASSGALLASSVSPVDNVQHLYIPLLQPGAYDLEVVKYGGVSQSLTPSEMCALAFEFYPVTPPLLAVSVSAANTVLTWPASPTVFTLQQTLSLSPPISWSNAAVQQWLTNNSVWVNVDASSGTSFYRLTL